MQIDRDLATLESFTYNTPVQEVFERIKKALVEGQKPATNNEMDEICHCSDGGAWAILHTIIPGKQVNFCPNCGGKLSPIS